MIPATVDRAGRRRRDVAGTYAKRWAAKEACSKALGTGLRMGIAWKDMSVRNLRTSVMLSNVDHPPQILRQRQSRLVAARFGVVVRDVNDFRVGGFDGNHILLHRHDMFVVSLQITGGVGLIHP